MREAIAAFFVALQANPVYWWALVFFAVYPVTVTSAPPVPLQDVSSTSCLSPDGWNRSTASANDAPSRSAARGSSAISRTVAVPADGVTQYPLPATDTLSITSLPDVPAARLSTMIRIDRACWSPARAWSSRAKVYSVVEPVIGSGTG